MTQCNQTTKTPLGRKNNSQIYSYRKQQHQKIFQQGNQQGNHLLAINLRGYPQGDSSTSKGGRKTVTPPMVSPKMVQTSSQIRHAKKFTRARTNKINNTSHQNTINKHPDISRTPLDKIHHHRHMC